MLEFQFDKRPIRFDVARFAKERPNQFLRLKAAISIGISYAPVDKVGVLRSLVIGLAGLCKANPAILVTPDINDLPGAQESSSINGYAMVGGLGTDTLPEYRSDPRVWLAIAGAQSPDGKTMPLPAVVNFFWHEAFHLVAEFSHTNLPDDLTHADNKRWKQAMKDIARALPSTLYDPVLKHEVGLYKPEMWA